MGAPDRHIEVRALAKLYTPTRGLRGVSFSASKGELIAIVGHNGAGKSTMLKLLACALRPDSGAVSVDGIPFADRRGIVRKVGYVPETPNLSDGFSVAYNLEIFARLFGCGKDRIDWALREFELEKFARSPVRTLSKGLKQRVNIARSLIPDPAVLLLDEPTSALDFGMTAEVYQLIRGIHASGKTVLFTTHRPEEIRTLATRILAIHEGSLVFDGTPEEYLASDFYGTLYT